MHLDVCRPSAASRPDRSTPLAARRERPTKANLCWSRRLYGIVIGMSGLTSVVLGQQGGTGSVAGKVTDRNTSLPVVEAQLQLAGTVRGARSNDAGEYRIASVPPGSYTLRVIRLGYSQTTQSIVVTAGQTVTADIGLAPSAVVIDQVVVTATGETQRRRESGASTASISNESLTLPAINNSSNALSSRAAGVTVINAGGTTGTNSRIRIRGSNSINLSNDPLIIIDGVPVSNRSDNFGVGWSDHLSL